MYEEVINHEWEWREEAIRITECDAGKSGSVHYKQQAKRAFSFLFFFYPFNCGFISMHGVSVPCVCLCSKPVAAAPRLPGGALMGQSRVSQARLLQLFGFIPGWIAHLEKSVRSN